MRDIARLGADQRANLLDQLRVPALRHAVRLRKGGGRDIALAAAKKAGHQPVDALDIFDAGDAQPRHALAGAEQRDLLVEREQRDQRLEALFRRQLGVTKRLWLCIVLVVVHAVIS
jgi:hypothetical protein